MGALLCKVKIMERKPYVSPEYQAQLDHLAETLAEGRRMRLADIALQDTVEFPAITDEQLVLDIPDNVLVGEE